MESQRKTDYNVELARCIAILCIVLHHSISIYSGWPPNSGIPIGLVRCEILLSIICKGIGLGLFSFISGYLARYSILSKESFYKKIKKRVIRILVPMILGGVGYYLLFPNMMNNGNPILGTHLWYLPVIFLCYLFLIVSKVLQDKVGSPIWVFFLIFFLLVIIQHYFIKNSLLSLSRVIWPIYVAGYYSLGYKDQLVKMFSKRGISIVLFFLFCIPSFLYVSSPSAIIGSITEFCFEILVSPFLFIFVCLFNKDKLMPILLRAISIYSFQIYLLHQFVINILLLVLLNSYDNFGSIPHFCSIVVIFVLAVILPIVCCRLFNDMLNINNVGVTK